MATPWVPKGTPVHVEPVLEFEGVGGGPYEGNLVGPHLTPEMTGGVQIYLVQVVGEDVPRLASDGTWEAMDPEVGDRIRR